jgi:glycosyltransferase involved in cell wall biosynthesis
MAAIEARRPDAGRVGLSTSANAGATASPAEIVPQRCVIVLPTGGAFDSRTYRIARTLHERGHRVTVLGRLEAGLPRHEIHPVGYPIIRVEATAIDGLPFAGLVMPALRALRRPGRRGPVRSQVVAPAESAAPGPADATASTHMPPVDVDRKGVLGYLRRARIFMLIRSHRRRALEVAPAADVYHGMAYMGIPVALTLGKKHGGKIVYDARDIYMVAANLAKMRGPIKTVLARLERGWARAAACVFTVNAPYADELAKRFDVPTPVIVMNCSYRFTPPAQRPRLFHDRLGLDPGARVVLYQGGFMEGRGVEQLIEAVRRVPGAVLVAMGYGGLEAAYRKAAERPENQGKLLVLPAVPPAELLDWVASADVVGVLFQHDTLNHYLSTPNKFFEAMSAGVPSVCSDHPGMGPIARATGCAIAVPPDDVAAIAEAIRSIVEAPAGERDAMRARALRAAHETYNWESQVEALLAEYTRLTGRQW